VVISRSAVVCLGDACDTLLDEHNITAMGCTTARCTNLVLKPTPVEITTKVRNISCDCGVAACSVRLEANRSGWRGLSQGSFCTRLLMASLLTFGALQTNAYKYVLCFCIFCMSLLLFGVSGDIEEVLWKEKDE
jgi:hypothetical protein